jgi:hypothetical protein
MKGKLAKAAAILGVGAGAAAAYEVLVRRWQLGFGATVEEILRPMPLDDRVAQPNHLTNRAITIHAAPEAIWPWLAQVKDLPRRGFASYVTRDRSDGLIVQAIEPGRHLVLGPRPTKDLSVTWALGLYPAADGSATTRLVSRCRAWIRPALRRLAWFLILDSGQLLMERRVLLEIRRRAEGGPARSSPAPSTAVNQ